MATTVVNSDLRVNGDFSAATMTVPASAVVDASVASSAAITAAKLQLMHRGFTNFDLAIGGTPVAREEIVFVCSQPNGATISAFHCLLNDTGTTTDVNFDLKKNGSSVLNAVVNITNADADRLVKDGTISSASLADGDVLSISLAVVSSTGAQGPFAWCEVKEVPE